MILITGGAGFLGSALVWALNRRNRDNIVIADNLGSGLKWRNLRPLKYLDFVEKEELAKLIQSGNMPDNINTVVHLRDHNDRFEINTDTLVRTNYNYSKLLADYCLQNRIRMIYASSSETYGLESFCDDKPETLEKLRPINKHAYSKHMFDLWVKRNNLFNNITGIKFSHIYGPNEYHKGNMASAVLKAWREIKETGEINQFNSCKPEQLAGHQVDDFIYIKDAVRVILFFLDHPQANGLFNAATGQSRTFEAMQNILCQSMGIGKKVNTIEPTPEFKQKYSVDRHFNTTALERLGYHGHKYSLEEGIEEYVKTYLKDDICLGDGE